MSAEYLTTSTPLHHSSPVTGRLTADPLAPARASVTLDAVALFDDLEAIVGHSRPFTFAELTDSLAERRMRKQVEAHARWEAHRLEEIAALEAEYELLADSNLDAIVEKYALSGTRMREAAHAVLARRKPATAPPCPICQEPLESDGHGDFMCLVGHESPAWFAAREVA